MIANRKLASIALAAALIGGGGAATVSSSSIASTSHSVTQRDEARWAIRWISDPNVTRLINDLQSVQSLPNDVTLTAAEHAAAHLANDTQAIRDHAPDSPFDNKDLDKALADIESAFKAASHGDVNTANKQAATAQKDSDAFTKKLNDKFPASTSHNSGQKSTAPDSWVQGQIDWAKSHGING